MLTIVTNYSKAHDCMLETGLHASLTGPSVKSRVQKRVHPWMANGSTYNQCLSQMILCLLTRVQDEQAGDRLQCSANHKARPSCNLLLLFKFSNHWEKLLQILSICQLRQHAASLILSTFFSPKQRHHHPILVLLVEAHKIFRILMQDQKSTFWKGKTCYGSFPIKFRL